MDGIGVNTQKVPFSVFFSQEKKGTQERSTRQLSFRHPTFSEKVGMDFPAWRVPCNFAWILVSNSSASPASSAGVWPIGFLADGFDGMSRF